MTTANTTAADRIEAAHDRLLAALTAPQDAPLHVVDAVLRRRGDALGNALAQLVGSLSAATTLTGPPYNQPLTPDALAELVERVVEYAAADAERAVGAAYLHALPPIDYPGRLAGIEPSPRCGAQGRTALFAADVTCPACVADMAQAENGGAR
jgi:hypothetical protein